RSVPHRESGGSACWGDRPESFTDVGPRRRAHCGYGAPRHSIDSELRRRFRPLAGSAKDPPDLTGTISDTLHIGGAGGARLPGRLTGNYICNVPTISPTFPIPSRSRNSPSSRAIRAGDCGSQNVAVPTCTALAPEIKTSAASSPVAIPPSPITVILTLLAAWYTSRSAMGLM